ncbi:MAG: amidophosphoribosyltransferase [Clostridia bacterium]|nr:amidophosphoribosyltransferase [Candidatus Pelethousia sp.]NCB31706.1 amidophosphoribosyltransferase [Clostridia bacterium]
MPRNIRLPEPYERRKPDGDCMHEECGVFGIYSGQSGIDAAEAVYYGLLSLQHRGQESAGIAVVRDGQIESHKAMGLVQGQFREGLENFMGAASAIGHVRYSTMGDSQLLNAQPVVIDSPQGRLALAHNGNITNAKALREALEDRGVCFETSIDSEVVAALIASHSESGILQGVIQAAEQMEGSYALTIMTPDVVMGVRDPLGVRPLALGRLDDAYVLSSESCAFDTIGAEFIRDIRPGEIVVADKNGLRSHQMAHAQDTALCIFEYVYFARPDSDIDGISVHKARERAGELLAIASPAEADVVTAVPDSAMPAAMGYARQAGLPFVMAFAQNRYVGRTFIQPSQGRREIGVSLKLSALKRSVRGKRVLLVDDSIVRGTTSKRIVEMLKTAGAKEVHIRISSPPVTSPCFLGIDTSSHEQLIGANHSVEEIRKFIGADSLAYLSFEDLLKTVEGAACNFCAGCFNGKYPTDVSELLHCGKKNMLG